MATQPACTYYAYNVPADMTDLLATMIRKETDCEFHITSVKQHNETVLAFEKPGMCTKYRRILYCVCHVWFIECLKLSLITCFSGLRLIYLC